MIITKIDRSSQGKLYNNLFSYVSSFRRRGVSISIFAHSGLAANIIIRATGLKGTPEKNIVVVFNSTADEWIAYSEGTQYNLISLSEITIIIKNRIQKLHTLTSKL